MESTWGHFVDTDEDIEYIHKKKDDFSNKESDYESEYDSDYENYNDYDPNYCTYSMYFNIVLVVLVLWKLNS